MKKLYLVSALALVSMGAQAQIPVTDGASIAQSVTNSVQEIAKMAEVLAEAQAQLEELQKQVTAITGDKGFGGLMSGTLGGLNTEVTSTVKDLLGGNVAGLAAQYKDVFTVNTDCSNAKDKNICNAAEYEAVQRYQYYTQTLPKQIDEKLKKVTQLSEKIKTTQDLKAIAELQAEIQLEANSIALLQQTSQLVKEAGESVKYNHQEQIRKEITKIREESLKIQKASASSTSSASNYGNILNK